MRDTDEQLREILRRTQIVREKRALQNRLGASALGLCLCAALLIAACASLPHLTAVSQNHDMQRYGSLLLTAPYMGYAVVGLLAFALGVCATLLCFCWKELKQREQGRK